MSSQIHTKKRLLIGEEMKDYLVCSKWHNLILDWPKTSNFVGGVWEVTEKHKEVKIHFESGNFSLEFCSYPSGNYFAELGKNMNDIHNQGKLTERRIYPTFMCVYQILHEIYKG